jgi:hypothetical protein
MMVGARAFQASVVLRVLAIAIAVAGVVDPAITLTGSTPARLAVVEQAPASPVSARLRSQLVRDLGAAYQIVPEVTSDSAAAIVIGDRYPASSAGSDVVSGFLTDAALAKSVSRTVATVSIGPPNVRFVHVSAPRDVPAATIIHLEGDVDARGVAGQSIDLIARIAGLEVGRASHQWTRDRERWHATLDVVPIGDPPFVVHLDAGAPAADSVVPLRTRPLRVQVYDPRPSWASTFVRRALEEDPRFHVESVSVSSRGVAARTVGATSLSDPRLDRFEALIVSGLDRLSAADIHALDRYMRERGGAVVLLPDQRVDRGPARDLLPDVTERLLERPATLASPRAAAALQASEILQLRNLPSGTDVVAAMPGADAAPVVVSIAHGAGRLFVSGAMDAWRFRVANERAFDRFWQAAVAGLALGAPPPLAVAVSPPAVRPGEPADVIVRARSRDTAARISASVDGDHPLRLWPDAEAGVYRGRFVAGLTPGRATIDVVVSGGTQETASQVVPVRPGVHRDPEAVIPPLSMLSASHGGIDVTPDRVADVVRFVRDNVKPPRAPLNRHPMRSVWWIVPFTACLSGEWWLRRRQGKR